MRPTVLIVLDGWGYSKQRMGNAILYAQTPFIDSVERDYPSMLLQASGKSVGMTWGEAGNSEVGHFNIGAGRIVFQYLSRINKAIGDLSFFKNGAFVKTVEHVKTNNSALHLVGLLTSGSVHAHISHIFALIDLAAQNGIANLRLHLFTDGKDSGLQEAPALIKKLEEHIAKAGTGAISTVIGRDYAMDRAQNWENTKKAYRLLVSGLGEKVNNLTPKIELFYTLGYTDSKLPPIVNDDHGFVQDGDAIIFFNFREDSMRQIVRSFTEPDFKFFPTEKFDNLFVVTMTQYLEIPSLNVVFGLPEVKNGLAEVLSNNNKTQLHVAESEKYAHATYFFNCLKNTPYPGESDVFIESLEDYESNPEMGTMDIAEKIIEGTKQNQYDFYIANFANPDILSHTGNLEATIRGVETVDKALKQIAEAILEKDGVMAITADHGNAESMVYASSGEKKTTHELSPVPFYLIGKRYQRERTIEEREQAFIQANGILADVAPTILELMDISKPEEMTGDSLLRLLT